MYCEWMIHGRDWSESAVEDAGSAVSRNKQRVGEGWRMEGHSHRGRRRTVGEGTERPLLSLLGPFLWLPLWTLSPK